MPQQSPEGQPILPPVCVRCHHYQILSSLFLEQAQSWGAQLCSVEQAEKEQAVWWVMKNLSLQIWLKSSLSQWFPQGKQSKAKMQDLVMELYVLHSSFPSNKQQESETKLHLPAAGSSSLSCTCVTSAKRKCGSAKLEVPPKPDSTPTVKIKVSECQHVAC